MAVNIEKYLHVVTANENYCIPVLQVVTVNPIVFINSTENEKTGFIGEICFHGKDISVVDVAQYLGLRFESCYGLDALMVVCEFKNINFALLVDHVLDLVDSDRLTSFKQQPIFPLNLAEISEFCVN